MKHSPGRRKFAATSNGAGATALAEYSYVMVLYSLYIFRSVVLFFFVHGVLNPNEL